MTCITQRREIHKHPERCRLITIGADGVNVDDVAFYPFQVTQGLRRVFRDLTGYGLHRHTKVNYCLHPERDSNCVALTDAPGHPQEAAISPLAAKLRTIYSMR